MMIVWLGLLSHFGSARHTGAQICSIPLSKVPCEILMRFTDLWIDKTNLHRTYFEGQPRILCINLFCCCTTPLRQKAYELSFTDDSFYEH